MNVNDSMAHSRQSVYKAYSNITKTLKLRIVWEDLEV